jgi:hypothetical protein
MALVVQELPNLKGIVFAGTLVEALDGGLQHIKQAIKDNGAYEVDNVTVNVVTDPAGAPEWQLTLYEYI